LLTSYGSSIDAIVFEGKYLPILFVLYLKINSIFLPHCLQFSRKLRFPFGQKKIHGKFQEA